MSLETKDLSIIVPVFNGELYLERCVDSIFQQDLKTDYFEVILIDDGSSDNSQNIIEKLISIHDNISYFKQTNKGPGAARNLGLKKAIGAYIYFIDCDDYLIKGALNYILKTAKSNKLDLLGFDSTPVFENTKSNELKAELQDSIETVLDIKSGCDFVVQHNFRNEVWWFVAKKEHIQNTNVTFPEGRMLEDVAYTAKLILKAKRIGYIPVKIHRYYRHSSSVLNKLEINHYKRLIRDYESAIFDYEGVYEISKKCPKKAINRIKARQESFVFFMITRVFKSKIEYKTLFKTLKKIESIHAYPMRNFIGKDYHSFQLKLLTQIYNNRTLLWISFKLYRLLRG